MSKNNRDALIATASLAAQRFLGAPGCPVRLLPSPTTPGHRSPMCAAFLTLAFVLLLTPLTASAQDTPSLRYTPFNSPLTVNVAITRTPAVENFTPESYAVTGGTLPTGITFNSTSGVIGGSPTRVELGRTVTITATAGSQEVSTDFDFPEVRETGARAPDAPAALRLTPDRNEMSVLWMAPANNGAAISSYVVQFKLETATIWVTAQVMPMDILGSSGQIETALSGLTEGTTYQVRVRAVNGVGNSPWSPAGEATTTTRADSFTLRYWHPDPLVLKAGRPITPVIPTWAGTVFVSDGSPVRLTPRLFRTQQGADLPAGLRFDQPECALEIIQFNPVPGCMALGDQGNTIELVTGRAGAIFGTPTEATVNTAGEELTVPVTIEASAGAGEAARGVIPHTINFLIVVPRLSYTAPASLTVGTAITDMNPTDTRFDVAPTSYAVTDGTLPPGLEINTSTGVISGTPTTVNTDAVMVTVMATGGSETADHIITFPAVAADVPNAPAAPTLEKASQQLDVSWTAPAANGSAITDYDVRYREKPTSGDPAWTSLDDTGTNATDTTTTATIPSLTNGTIYEVQVRAGNSLGDGSWSPSAEGTPENAAATFGGDLTGAVTEDATETTATGTVMVTDRDGADTVQAQSNVEGTYGTFSIAASGDWTYTLQNTRNATNALAADATETDEFAIQSADSTAGTVTITVTGANDAPTADAGTDDTVVEGASVTLAGIGSSDPDASTTLTYSWARKAGETDNAVTLTGANTASASFTAPDDITADATLTFVLTVSDGTASDTDEVVITVTGANAAATFDGDLTGAVTEDATETTATGTVMVTDSDGANTVRAQTGTDAADGTYGTFSIEATGAWTYTLDNADADTNALAAGATATDEFTIQSADSTEGTVTITVTGANDAPTADAGTDTTVAEGVSVPLDGTGSDPDAGTTLTYAWARKAGETNNVVTLTNANTASASFTAPDDITADATLTFVLTVSDGMLSDTDEVVITVTGANAAATIGGDLTGAVTEDATETTATGTVTVTDSDGANTVQAQTGTDAADGDYGTFSIEATGAWTYTLDNTDADTNALAAAATATDAFPIAAADGTAGTVTITITGANDAPTADAGTDATVAEGVSVTLSGTGSDPDTGASLTYAWARKAGETNNAVTLTGANTASASFNAPDDITADATLTFVLTVSDGTLSDTDEVVITVTGANAAATFDGDLTGAVTEDATETTATGTVMVTDSDGANTVQAQTDAAGTYGTFSIATSGAWTYTLDNTITATNALAAAATATDAFTINAADGTEGTVTITVTGANDAPTADAGANATVAEGVSVTLSGTGSDPDTGASLTYAWARKAGETNNAVTLTGANTASASFAAPDDITADATLTFVLTVSDGTASDTDEVVITVTGANAAATIGGDLTGAVTEDATETTATGTVTVTDSDGANTVQAQTGTDAADGTYGTFSIEATGAWTYTLDNTITATNALAAAATATDAFPIAAADGTAGTVTITVTGANDAPTADAGADREVAEGASVTLSGTGSDPDTGASLTYAWARKSGETNNAVTLTGANTASASFTAPDDITADATLTFVLTVSDGTASDTDEVAITVTGANAAATFGGDLTGTVTEDATQTTGTVTVTDSDGANTVQAQTTANGTYGVFSIETTGVWTYMPNNQNTNALAAGATVTDAFTITSADGTTSNVTITITGVNDAPAANAGADQSVPANASVTLSGTGSDPDTGASLTYAWARKSGETNNAVTLTNANTASASFTAPSDITSNVTLTFVLTVSDGTASNTDEVVITVEAPDELPSPENLVVTGGVRQVTATWDAVAGVTSYELRYRKRGTGEQFGDYVQVNGTTQVIENLEPATTYIVRARSIEGMRRSTEAVANGRTDELAEIIGDVTGSVTEAGVDETGVAISSGQVRMNQSGGSIDPLERVSGVYGEFSLTAAGEWSYSLEDEREQTNALTQGLRVTETFAVSAVDSAGGQITGEVNITVTGTNDAPTANAGTDQLLAEGVSVILSGTGSDPDAGASLTYSWARKSGETDNAVTLADANTDTATFTTPDDITSRTALTFVLTVSDGTASSTDEVVITVTADNAAATFGGDLTGTVTEDATETTATGMVTVDDSDGANSIKAQTNVEGIYGSFSIESNGNWTYMLNNENANALTAGSTATDTFSITSADGTMSTVTITVTGTNDAPTVDAGTDQMVAEGMLVTLSGTGNDPDAGASLTYSWARKAGETDNAVTLADANTATATFTAPDDLTSEVTLTFVLTVSDGTASSTDEVVITVTGDNATATFGGDLTGAVTEDATETTATGMVTVDDSDGANSIEAQTNVEGIYGSFSIESNGNWTYMLNNENANALTAGSTATDTFSITSADGTMSTVTITVTGTNDAPTVDAGTDQMVAEGMLVTLSGTGNDPDAGASLTYSWARKAGETDNAVTLADANTATATFTTPDDITSRTALTFVLTVSDGTASSTDEVVITVTADNATATFGGDLTGAVTEDATETTATGMVTVDDSDGANSIEAQTNVEGIYGSFSIESNGNWTYMLNNENANALTAGSTATDTFTITSADGTMSTVTITVTGTNDAPTVDAGTDQMVAEGMLVTLSGTGNDPDAGASLTYSWARKAGETDNAVTLADANTATATFTAPDDLTSEVTLTFVLTVSDGTASSTDEVVITVTADNAAATFSGDLTGAVTEDATETTATGMVTVDDSDGANSIEAQTNVEGIYGSFSIESNGNWTYMLNNENANALTAGSTATDTFSITSADGTMSTVTITVTGTNDAPTVDAGTDQMVAEGMLVTLSGTGNDPDAGASLTYSWARKSGETDNAVTLADANTDTATFTAPDDLTSEVTLTFVLTVSDGTASSTDEVVITVTGDNATATFGGDLTGAVTEDATETTATGMVTVDDSDGANSIEAQTNVEGIYGSFSIESNGNWTYMLNNENANALTAGSTATDTFSITSADGTMSTVTITVTGTNDAPVLASIDDVTALTLTEVRLDLQVSDVDSDALRYRAESDNPDVVTVMPGEFMSWSTDSQVTINTQAEGTATVTVVLSDGEAETSTQFQVTARALTALSASLGASDSANEGTDLLVPVTLSSAPAMDEAMRVRYAVGAAGDTASSADWRSVESELVLPPGESSGTIRIEILDDALSEPEETLTVSLLEVSSSNPRRNSLMLNTSSTYAIAASDALGVALSVSTMRILEGRDTAVFRVSLSGGTLESPLTVGVSVHPNSTAGANDLMSLPSRLTLASGARETEFSIRAIREPGVQTEGEEILTLAVTLPMSGLNASIAEATTSIVIDEIDSTARTTGLELGLGAFARSIGGGLTDAIGARSSALQSAHGEVSSLQINGMSLTGAPQPVQASGEASGAQGMESISREMQVSQAVQSLLAPLSGLDGNPGMMRPRFGFQDLLSNGDFLLTSDSETGSESGSGASSPFDDWALWGEGSLSRFNLTGSDGRTEGDLMSARVAFDVRLRDELLVGLALSRDVGDADYALSSGASGSIDMHTTGIYPYVHWRPVPELGTWGTMGYGSGEARLEDGTDSAVETDIELGLIAAGIHREMFTLGKADWALKSDAFLATVDTDDVEGGALLPSASSRAWRLRTALEASADLPAANLSGTFAAGVLLEGGDATDGSGVELGAGISYANFAAGIEARLQGRYMSSLRGSRAEDWGASLSVLYDPGAPGRGLSVTASPEWGQASTSAVGWNNLESLGTVGLGGFRADGRSLRIPVRLAYGMDLGNDLLLAPTAEWISEGSFFRWRTGALLTLPPTHGFDVQLGLYQQQTSRERFASANQPGMSRSRPSVYGTGVHGYDQRAGNQAMPAGAPGGFGSGHGMGLHGSGVGGFGGGLDRYDQTAGSGMAFEALVSRILGDQQGQISLGASALSGKSSTEFGAQLQFNLRF